MTIEAASEPASGSVSANTGMNSPEAMDGRNSRFTASEPAMTMGVTASPQLEKLSENEALSRAMRSEISSGVTMSGPMPP